MTDLNHVVAAELSIIPRGDEARAKFFKQLEEWIEHSYIIEGAQIAQKDLMDNIASTFVDANEDVKKSDVKTRAKLMIDEMLRGKVTEKQQLNEDVLADVEIAKKNVKY